VPTWTYLDDFRDNLMKYHGDVYSESWPLKQQDALPSSLWQGVLGSFFKPDRVMGRIPGPLRRSGEGLGPIAARKPAPRFWRACIMKR